MGGQACVLYGAAEFSRDCDIVIVADDANLNRLKSALDDLKATCIAVPPFDPLYLEKGHAIHFRCQHDEAKGIRLDVMTKMRGCDDFASLWERRLTMQDDSGTSFELLGIEDLVQAKKTQRDKDWPMIRRLVDAHYDRNKSEASDHQVLFWLRESRSPGALIEISANYPNLRDVVLTERPAVQQALRGDAVAVQAELDKEVVEEKASDELYWRPLKAELESLRRRKGE